MDAKIKADWLEALRSGKYVQGKTYLENHEAHCCLGVLLEVQGCDVVAKWPDPADRCTCRLPTEYAAGVSEEHADYLAEMNDFQDKSFAEIADYIEAVL